MTQFMRMLADVCVESYDSLTLKYGPSADRGRQLFIGNCPVMMISPTTYKEVVAPADLYYRQQIGCFGLHHCGVMDKYLSAYQALEPVAFIEVGWGSSVEAVRRAFPNSKLDLMINVYNLQNMSHAEVRNLMVKMVREAGPLECLRARSPPTPRKSPPPRTTPTGPDESIRARKEDVYAFLDKKKAAQLVDVRSPDEFTGKILAPPGLSETAQRAGHIPGAANISGRRPPMKMALSNPRTR